MIRLHDVLRLEGCWPAWDKGVPRCSEDDCPSYDGKRCELLGMRPGGICEPAVEAMASELASLHENSAGT